MLHEKIGLMENIYNCLLTFIDRSPDAETIYLSSKSTTLTAARWPTKTLLNVISVAEFKSHTAIVLSFEHVIIIPSWKRRWSTASQWCIKVFNISPVRTSHILQKKNGLSSVGFLRENCNHYIFNYKNWHVRQVTWFMTLILIR